MSGVLLLPWLLAVAASWSLTALVRRYALSRSILDVPCQRSSHSVPTPRGGGLAIAAVALGGIVVAGALGLLPLTLTIALTGGGILVTTVGWLDDRHELGAGSRLFVHLLGALWFLAWFGGFQTVTIGSLRLELGMIGFALASLLIVWFVNLYNFMDGIDGLAAGHAVTSGLVGAALLAILGHADLALVALLIAAASAGFLIWNWAPARIFMGDAGSCLLGFLFCALALASEAASAVPLIGWMVVMGAFVFDATATLLRRTLRGEAWTEGHRQHAYQRAVQRSGAHAPVTAGILLLTLVLGAIAAWLTFSPDHHLIAIGAAAAVLTIAYWGVENVAPMPEPRRARERASVAREAWSPPSSD